MQDAAQSHSKKSSAEKLVNYANGLSDNKKSNKVSSRITITLDMCSIGMAEPSVVADVGLNEAGNQDRRTIQGVAYSEA